MPPIVIDLFSGVGGFSLGATRAGFSLIGAADNDPRAIKAHNVNFPNSRHWHVDLAGVSGKDLEESFGFDSATLTGIVGGPPCQGFSSMGHANIEDPRNKLFIHFFKLVSECLPDFFLAENVPGILNEQNDGIRREAVSFVDRDYILLEPMKLSANDYGAPTTRTRIFFFGYRKGALMDLKESDFAPPQNVETVLVHNALMGLPRKISHPSIQIDGWRKVEPLCGGAFGARLHGSIPKGVGDETSIKILREERKVSGCIGTEHSTEVERRFATIKPGNRDAVSKSVKLKIDGFCPTLRAGTGSDRGSYQAVRPLHPTENRVITPREAARLQGFPDWFQFDSTKWHSFRQIGNSVSPILAEHVLTVIKNSLIPKE